MILYILASSMFFFLSDSPVSFLCSVVSVCGLQLFTQLTMAKLFLKSNKFTMKEKAKLIKFNRKKMWLVAPHDVKITLLNDRKKKEYLWGFFCYRPLNKAGKFMFVWALFVLNLFPVHAGPLLVSLLPTGSADLRACSHNEVLS